MNVAQPINYKVYASNIAVILPSAAGANIQYKNSIDLYIDETHKIAVDGFTARYTPNNVALMFKAVDVGDDSEWQKLKTNWGDIVKSVDIFLTPQIVREKSDELISQIINEDKQSGIRKDLTTGDNQITEWESLWFVIPPETSLRVRHKVIFDIPMLSDKDYFNKISSTSTFFKVKSITLDDTLSSTFQELDLDKSVVQNLTAQEQMKDDYKTHNRIIPYGENAGMYIYNHRLNLSGISEKLFSGFRIADMVNTTDVHALGYADYPKADIMEMWVKIDTENGMKYVKNTEDERIHEYALNNAFLFYPDSRAKKMFIKYDDGNEKWLGLDMEPCPLLNGAFVIPNFFSKTFPTPVTAPSLTVKDESPMPNKIYTSEVDNPYYFPPEGINNIGTGEIIGLAATTRALSQGQFGQFPLMAFCTDGVWALDVASSGTYSTIHPISREVCVNKASICQLDQSVAFATAKGLARVAESSVVSMSEQLDGPMVELTATVSGTTFSTLLPGLYEHFAAQQDDSESKAATKAEIRSFLSFTTHPKDFFKSGRLLYDFANARIIILPSTLDPSPSTLITAYVLSLRDMAWSTMHLPALQAAINAYPHPYLQETNGKVMVLDKTYDYIHNVRVPSIIVTRTMSFAATMQVIQGFQQLSNCIKDYPPLMFIYGSNDNVNWYYVGKTEKQQANYLPGHPSRFFRLAIYMKMRPTEKYQTLILDVIEKYQKL
jgi:hypothetical protein